MRNLKAEKIWLCHYIAGSATADWMVGVRGRPTDIQLSHLLEHHQEKAARQVWLACRGVFTFSPSRFFADVEPGKVALAAMSNSFTACAGTAALANLIEDNLLPRSAIQTIQNDFKFSSTQWKAITREEVRLRILRAMWDATHLLFRESMVRECVYELAGLVRTTGVLCNANGALDCWFNERADQFEVLWSHFMPVEEVFREVSAAYLKRGQGFPDAIGFEQCAIECAGRAAQIVEMASTKAERHPDATGAMCVVRGSSRSEKEQSLCPQLA